MFYWFQYSRNGGQSEPCNYLLSRWAVDKTAHQDAWQSEMLFVSSSFSTSSILSFSFLVLRSDVGSHIHESTLPLLYPQPHLPFWRQILAWIAQVRLELFSSLDANTQTPCPGLSLQERFHLPRRPQQRLAKA